MKNDYLYIRAWGHHLGSQPYYINDEVQRARDTNAPETAIFHRLPLDGGEWQGEWATWEGIQDETTKRLIAESVEQMKAGQ